MFLSTRDLNGLYEFIVSACKKNCESLVKKKLELLVFKKKKFPTFHFLFFLFFILLSGKIIKKNRCEIKYKNLEIGKFILSFTFYNYECYLNKFKFYKLLIKNFLLAGSIINTCNYYYKKNNIKGIYIDHCIFMNGIIFSFFSQKNIPVYTNNYPHGIYFVNYKKNKKKYLLKYENTLKVNSKIKINTYQKKKAEKKISKLVKEKNFIPWLSQTKFKELKKINYKDFEYVIYCQSFTDGQMYYGYDGFENNLEWLEFTLNKFIKTKKKILIKPHPNYYNNTIAIYSLWDKKIYNFVVQKYKKYENLYFLLQPIHNYTLLKQLNKKCITISTMGSVVMENSYMNFKSISSACTFYNQKFNISNMWKNRKDYLELLNRDYSKLNKPNKNDLLTIIYTLFYTYHSSYNTNYWYLNVIKNNLKLSKEIFNKIFITKARSKILNSQSIKVKKLIYGKKDIIADKISRKIYEVKI